MTEDSVAKAKKKKEKRKARLAPLMTQDIRYRGYRYAIWKKIDELLFYPSAAVNAKVRGRVVVRFEVTRDGQLATLKLLNSSGFELLDEEALMAVRNAVPFPKFPSTINGNRIAIRSEIFYGP
jgi:protein TonB